MPTIATYDEVMTDNATPTSTPGPTYLAEHAATLMGMGDYDGALALIDAGQDNYPGTTINGLSWDHMRRAVEGLRK
jgi:hypothetical protein